MNEERPVLQVCLGCKGQGFNMEPHFRVVDGKTITVDVKTDCFTCYGTGWNEGGVQ